MVRLLTTRPVRRLGSYSYSLYLLHVPIVLGISRTVAAHYAAPGLPAFWVDPGTGGADLAADRAVVRGDLRDSLPAVPQLGRPAQRRPRPDAG